MDAECDAAIGAIEQDPGRANCTSACRGGVSYLDYGSAHHTAPCHSPSSLRCSRRASASAPHLHSTAHPAAALTFAPLHPRHPHTAPSSETPWNEVCCLQYTLPTFNSGFSLLSLASPPLHSSSTLKALFSIDVLNTGAYILLIAIAVGWGIALVEWFGGGNPGFRPLHSGVYFALTTLTTVGCGDCIFFSYQS